MFLMLNQLVVFTDGGARGNPGPAAAGFTIQDDSGKSIYQGKKYLGQATNNVAEYSAVIEALQWLAESKIENQKITFFLDSDLIVNQLNGVYKIKDAKLKLLSIKVRFWEDKIPARIVYCHIPRQLNKIADTLVNQCLDQAADNRRFSR